MIASEMDMLAAGLAPVIKDLMAPLFTRIADLERRLETVTNGKDGEQGEKGARGASFYTGVGAPSFASDPGDAYLDVKTGDIYQWR